MINAIGAMHATLRAKKSRDDETDLVVEVKKRRRKPALDQTNERPQRPETERGRTA